METKNKQTTQARYLSYEQTKKLVNWLSSDIFALEPDMKEIVENLRSQVKNHEELYGLPNTSKLFAVAICDRCNRVEQWEVKDYSECAYESEKMLSLEELKKAVDNGNVGFSEHYASCEGCADDYVEQGELAIAEMQEDN
jgi:hypothetical protein